MSRPRGIAAALAGCQVNVALRDGARIEDCELISVGRGSVATLWLVVNGENVFIPHRAVLDLWPTSGGARRGA
jgi:hypothetical protein